MTGEFYFDIVTKSLISKISEQLLENIKEQVNVQIKSALQNELTSTISGVIESNNNSLKEVIGKELLTVSSHINSKFNSIEGKLLDISPQLKEATDLIKNESNKEIMDYLENSLLKKIEGKLSGNVQLKFSVLEAMKQLEKIDNTITSANITDIYKQVESVKNYLSETKAQQEATLETKVDDIKNSIIKEVSSLNSVVSKVEAIEANTKDTVKDVNKNIEDKFAEADSSIADISRKVESVKSAFLETTTQQETALNGKVEDIKESIIKEISSLSSIASKIETIEANTKTTAADVNKTIEDKFAGATSSITDISKQVESVKSAFLETTAQQEAALNGKVEGIKESIIKEISSLSSIASKIEVIETNTKDAAKDVNKTIEDQFTEAANSIADISKQVESVKSAFLETTTQQETALNGKVEDIKESIIKEVSGLNSIKAKIDSIETNTKDTAADINKIIGDNLSAHITDLKEHTASSFDKFTEASASISDMSKQMETIKHYMSETSKQQEAALNAKVEDAQSNIVKEMSNLNTIISKIDSIETHTKDAVIEINKATEDKLGANITALKEHIASSFDKFIEASANISDISKQMETIKHYLSEATKHQEAAFSAKVEDTRDIILKEVSDISSITNRINGIEANTKNTVVDINKAVEDKLGAHITSLKDHMVSKFDRFTETADSKKDIIINEIMIMKGFISERNKESSEILKGIIEIESRLVHLLDDLYKNIRGAKKS